MTAVWHFGSAVAVYLALFCRARRARAEPMIDWPGQASKMQLSPPTPANHGPHQDRPARILHLLDRDPDLHRPHQLWPPPRQRPADLAGFRGTGALLQVDGLFRTRCRRCRHRRCRRGGAISFGGLPRWNAARRHDCQRFQQKRLRSRLAPGRPGHWARAKPGIIFFDYTARKATSVPPAFVAKAQQA